MGVPLGEAVLRPRRPGGRAGQRPPRDDRDASLRHDVLPRHGVAARRGDHRPRRGGGGDPRRRPDVTRPTRSRRRSRRVDGRDGRPPLLPERRGRPRGARGAGAGVERLRRRPHSLLGQHRGQGAVQPGAPCRCAGARRAARRRDDVPPRHVDRGGARLRAEARRLARGADRVARRPRLEPCHRARRRGEGRRGAAPRRARHEGGVLPVHLPQAREGRDRDRQVPGDAARRA